MRRSLALSIMPLAMAETLVWAAFYYAHPAFLPAWEADLGWSRAEIAGAFTAALILTGVLAPQAGRFIDRGWARPVFLGCTAIGGLLLLALSQVTQLWQFWAIWLALGVVNAAVLYEACFAIITVTVGGQAKRAITIVTLFAGFANTICFPSAFFLCEWLGWRGAAMVFGAVILSVALPLAAIGFSWLEAHRDTPVASAKADASHGRKALRNPVFWAIGFAFTAIGITHGMIVAHILPLLGERGVAAAVAVLVAASFGPCQVLGRLLMVALDKHLRTFAMAGLCFLGIAGGLGILYLGGTIPILAIVFVVPYASAYGIVSIVRPVLTAEFLGREGFGIISGMLAAPYMLGFALGPTLAAFLWAGRSYDPVILLGLILTLAGFGAILWARRITAI